MTKLIINRMGTITTRAQDEFQCKIKGHPTYTYHLKITCDDKLDKQGFLIDHLILDQSIQMIASAKSIGSCEILAKNILSNIKEILYLRKVNYEKINIIIKPEEHPMAFMELEFSKP